MTPITIALEGEVQSLQLGYASMNEAEGKRIVTLGSKYGYVNVAVGETIPGTTLRVKSANADEAVITMNNMQVKLPIGGTNQ